MKPIKITYGADNDQFYQLYLNTEKMPSKIIILVHGGYWRSQINLEYLEDLANYFIDKGYTVANIEYRRGVDNQWPIPYEDVTKAIEDIKKRYNHSDLITIGHSVGGQLALFTSHLVDKVIALAPVTDVNFTYQHTLGDNAVEDYFINLPNDGLLTQASPISHHLHTVKKVLVIQGKDDDRVLVETSDSYVQKQDNGEVEVDYLRLSSMPHIDIIDPKKSFWNYVTDWIE